MPETFPYYRGATAGAPAAKPGQPAPIATSRQPRQDAPEFYMPGEELEAAVNTALLLGLPLLVTGKPGCGKTQLGKAVAHALGHEHFKFDTKSTSQARDLFYIYDVVGRFQAAQIRRAESASGGQSPKTDAAEPRRFVNYQALGLAILLAQPHKAVADVLPVFGAETADDDHRALFRDDWKPQRSVVVIDEVDKAPRDFPNDILNEIDQFYFTLPELGGKRVPPPKDDLRPFVIFTSNSEKQLPDAFLRRCIYHHIAEPDRTRLLQILEARVGKEPERVVGGGGGMVEDAVDFYLKLREGGDVALKKPPGIAELINWIQALRGWKITELSQHSAEQVKKTLGALIKLNEDRDEVLPKLEQLLRPAGS